MNPDHGISSARPDVTWPISRHWEELTSFRVDEQMDMDLVATIAERNGHPQWEERVQFLRDFRMKAYICVLRNAIPISRATIFSRLFPVVPCEAISILSNSVATRIRMAT